MDEEMNVNWVSILEKTIKDQAKEIHQIKNALRIISTSYGSDVIEQKFNPESILIGCTQIARAALKGDE